MVTQSFALAVCIGFFLPIVAFGDPAATNLPLRAAVTLSDGSRVLGIPRIASIPFQTAYAKIDLPLKQVQSIKIESDHESVALALTNGDRLKGTLQLKPIEMETLFGIVKIDFTLIAGISVYPGGKGSLPGTLQEGLVLYYSFDKDEGDKVTDESGKGHDGAVKGATWTADGKVGGAYRFVGKHDYIGLPSGGVIPGGSFTILAWIRPVEIGSLMVCYVQGTGSYISLRVDARGGFAGCADGNNLDQSITTLSADNWYHVGMVYDGSHNTVYVNGVNETRNARTANYTRDIATIGAGNQSGRPEYYFTGLIDDVRIYDRALSEDEVKTLYDAQK